MFFDKNNQYNDKTSSNTNVLTSDQCYQDKFGNQFCQDTTRLQNKPPSLITDVKNCSTLINIGSFKNSETADFSVEEINGKNIGVWSYSDDRPIHGGIFYNEVSGSKDTNENYSQPLQPLVGDCSI